MNDNKPYFRDLERKKHLFVDAVRALKVEFLLLDGTQGPEPFYAIAMKDKRRYSVSLNVYQKVGAYLDRVYGTEGSNPEPKVFKI